LKRVEHLPGVNSASYTQFLPLGTAHSVTFVGRQLGKDPNAVTVDAFRVEPGFFGTMGIPLRGRDLTQTEADAGKPDAVVINETLAQRMWPGEDPIGKHFALSSEKTMSQVVGVVKNGKYRTLGKHLLLPSSAARCLRRAPSWCAAPRQTRGRCSARFVAKFRSSIR
jgi:hypothetical protein